MWDKIKATIVFVPTLIWNMLLGRWLKVRNWWDRIDDTLIVGAMPFEKDVPKLAEAGVTCVVNTCAEYEGPQEAYEKYGIKQLHVPTVDFTHPSLENVQKAVDFIEQETAGGGTAYVHCKAGRARSATVALCWLIRNLGLSPVEAQKLLLEKRPHINPRVYGRPVVKEFLKTHSNGEKNALESNAPE
ncbi:MAG: phosphatidylglycerophosphatase and protein-tyrosine phosphatase 1 family protein [Pirellulaceae bacterium]